MRNICRRIERLESDNRSTKSQYKVLMTRDATNDKEYLRNLDEAQKQGHPVWTVHIVAPKVC